MTLHLTSEGLWPCHMRVSLCPNPDSIIFFLLFKKMAFEMKETKITADHEGKVLILRLYSDVCVGGCHVTCLFIIYECSLRKQNSYICG